MASNQLPPGEPAAAGFCTASSPQIPAVASQYLLSDFRLMTNFKPVGAGDSEPVVAVKVRRLRGTNTPAAGAPTMSWSEDAGGAAVTSNVELVAAFRPLADAMIARPSAAPATEQPLKLATPALAVFESPPVHVSVPLPTSESVITVELSVVTVAPVSV